MEEKQLTSRELEEQANALLAEADFEEIKLPKKAKKAAAASGPSPERPIFLRRQRQQDLDKHTEVTRYGHTQLGTGDHSR